MDMKNFIKFTAVLFAAITLSAVIPHLLELRVKNRFIQSGLPNLARNIQQLAVVRDF
jgi:hypothetical protein